MQSDSSIVGLPRENGELRKSLESPQSRTPSSASDRVDSHPRPPQLTVPTSMPQLPGLPPHLNFNPLMFGGLPSLDSLRKEDLEAAAAAAAAAASGKRPPIPNIPNVPNLSTPTSLGVGGPAGSIPKGPFTPEKL